jgi:lactate dehydrogenase-like 2-hydroxyacid dehydrogenase
VNNARGGVVDAAAIPDAIASGQLPARASTCSTRNPRPPDHPLIAAWRDPITWPTTASSSNPTRRSTEEGLTEMRIKAHSHVAGRCWANRSETWSTACQFRSSYFIAAISVASVFGSTSDTPSSTS